MYVNSSIGQTPKLWALYERGLEGDRASLKKLISKSSSIRPVTYHIGRHRRRGRLGPLAYHRVQDLCSITYDEVNADDFSRRRKYMRFIKKHFRDLKYSEEHHTWILTPLEGRKIDYYIKELPLNKYLRDENEDKDEITYLKDSEKALVDSLISTHDSYVFVVLSRAMFYRRVFLLIDQDVMGYIRTLTKCEIGVQNYKSDIVYHMTYDYHNTVVTNYYAFWLNHYKEFPWNDDEKYFMIEHGKINPLSELEAVLDNMTSMDTTVALKAYHHLVNSDLELTYDRYIYEFKINRAIPIFWERFYRCIKGLKEYLTKNNYSVELAGAERSLANRLLENITFKERYSIENELIKKLSPSTISAFEVFMLFNEQNDHAQESAGRILDKFYSRNWELITSDDEHLRLYLKKAYLFDNLGIIGSCNSYAYKFEHSDKELLSKLQAISKETKDYGIKKSVSLIKRKQGQFESTKMLTPLKPTSQLIETVEELTSEIEKLYQKSVAKMEKVGLDYDYTYVLREVTYDLLSEAAARVRGFTYKHPRDYFFRYNFIVRSYGIPVEGLDNDSIWKDFDDRIKNVSKYDVYAHYINQTGIDIFNSEGKLDYDKVYEVLKYDTPQGFVGVGGFRDYGLFAVIKLLEIEFKTTFGFPEKCNTAIMSHTSNLVHRARVWRQHIISNNLMKTPDTEPISFVQEFM